MTDDAHDVCVTVFIDGIAHGLAVNGKTFISHSIRIIPARKRSVKVNRIDADQDATDDGLAGNGATAPFYPAAEALPSLGA